MITNLLCSAVCTAYIATGNPCANGKYPTINHTIAIPRAYSLGSIVIIDGISYIGEDRTARKSNGRFDIFLNSKREAINYGKQTHNVTVITK